MKILVKFVLWEQLDEVGHLVHEKCCLLLNFYLSRYTGYLPQAQRSNFYFLFFSDISVLSGMSFHTACSMSLIPVGLLFPLDLVRNNRIPNLTCIMPIKESSISFDIFTMIKLANRLKQEFEIAATNSIFNKSRLSP